MKMNIKNLPLTNKDKFQPTTLQGGTVITYTNYKANRVLEEYDYATIYRKGPELEEHTLWIPRDGEIYSKEGITIIFEL